MTKSLGRVLILVALIGLPGCGALDRLERVGKPPSFEPVTSPIALRGYAPQRIPMPMTEPVVFQANSLWASGSRAFFKDQRATRVGDILTVEIEIDDNAKVANTTSRSRDNASSTDAGAFFGFEGYLGRLLPGDVTPEALVDVGSSTEQTGAGTVDRSEAITLTVAAIVTDVLPNGNLVIQGKQEVRVNFELRELLVSGVVRPEDISNINTIRHTQIAEARISYGGRGQITDLQQPAYGQQVIEILSPF
ncbi:MAG: flagellar basal body L-ring protein FlgH [Alphaproteobacteria bacterium]|nr:flagellar basal body L-ring protein FlgH [Alphaproteobacteria bacterium]